MEIEQKKNKWMSIRIDPDTRQKLTEIAIENNCSKVELLRNIINDYLRKHKRQGKKQTMI